MVVAGVLAGWEAWVVVGGGSVRGFGAEMGSSVCSWMGGIVAVD